MFEPTSRYAPLETLKLERPDGRVIAYKRRRFLPPGEEMPLLVEVTVDEDTRLDRVAHRTLGDPEQDWRVSDANDAMHPGDLAARPGEILRVPVPQA